MSRQENLTNSLVFRTIYTGYSETTNKEIFMFEFIIPVIGIIVVSIMAGAFWIINEGNI